MSGKIKLNSGSGGGSVSIEAPSSSSNNRVFSLPDSADGTIAKTSDISFTSYAIIADVKASNADGGSFTTGDWRTRDLNTEISDVDNIVSISSNQFTLAAGTYLIEFEAPACRTGVHQTRLYNATTSSAVQDGSNQWAGANSGTSGNRSFGYARVTISGSTAFEIQHQSGIDGTGSGTFGFGVGTSGYMDWGSPIYTIVKIFKQP